MKLIKDLSLSLQVFSKGIVISLGTKNEELIRDVLNKHLNSDCIQTLHHGKINDLLSIIVIKKEIP
jgi:hypothetical protein